MCYWAKFPHRPLRVRATLLMIASGRWLKGVGVLFRAAPQKRLTWDYTLLDLHLYSSSGCLPSLLTPNMYAQGKGVGTFIPPPSLHAVPSSIPCKNTPRVLCVLVVATHTIHPGLMCYWSLPEGVSLLLFVLVTWRAIEGVQLQAKIIPPSSCPLLGCKDWNTVEHVRLVWVTTLKISRNIFPSTKDFVKREHQKMCFC